MATNNTYPIGRDWVNLNNLTGIKIGETMYLQNLGRSGDLIEIAISAQIPLDGFRGIAIPQMAPWYRAQSDKGAVWVRLIQYDLTGTITPSQSKTCLLSVQENLDISELRGSISGGSSGGLDADSLIVSSLLDIKESLNAVNDNLKLLNARAEEAWETRIILEDVTNGTDSR
jgi:hypothetical protein